MPKDKLLEIKGGGCGCILIKTGVFEKMGQNKWFEYIEYPDGNSLSEDLSFCHKVRTKFGYKIFAHTAVRCGHVFKVIR